MESNEVEISTRAREREKEREGNEGQRHEHAEQHLLAHAEQDFEQLCHRQIVGRSVYKCLLLSLTLSYIFLYQPYPSLLTSLSTNLEDNCIFTTKIKQLSKP